MKFVKYSALKFFLASTSLTLSTFSIYAQQQIPDINTVIASWEPEQLSITSLNEAEKVLSSSRYITAKGNERERVARFTNSMRANFTSLNAGQQERLVILEARLLQSTHRFEEAKQHLKQIVHFQSPAAHLLMADIATQQGDVKKAKENCEKLVGKTSFLIAFTCMVNAEFSQNAQPKLLQKLKAFETYTSNARPSERQWFYEVLADMSLQLGYPEAALSYLSQTEFEKLPISALLVWSDANFQLRNYEVVTATLAHNIKKADDGLLLKWAIAERAQGITSSTVQSQLSKNMEIRVWREDSSHAAQVATYFLEVEQNYSLALKFAEINWQYAQASSDEELLERARQANDESTNA